MVSAPALPAHDEIQLRLCHRPPGLSGDALLRQLLRPALGAAASDAVLLRGPHGRPELAPPHEALRFSLSHCGPWLLFAVAIGVQPGVDIEALAPRPNALRLAERYFDPIEAAELRALPGAQREWRFYHAWTAREAVLKAIGRGLAFGLQRLRIGVDAAGAPSLLALQGDDPLAWQLHSVAAPDGFVAALAWRGGPRRLVGPD
jgi:4'-phosphopantetheinyl transferase